MTEETLTPEETAALEAMESDATEEAEEVSGVEEDDAKSEAGTDDEIKGEEGKDEEGVKPEFKSSRADDQKPPEGYVPHQAMHAERLKRQELERRLEAIEAERQKTQEESPPEFVDPLENPDAYRKWAEYQAKQPQQAVQQLQDQLQQQQQQQMVMADVQKSESEFASKTPDYQNAISHLHSTRVSELQGMGYAHQEIQAQVQRDAQAIYQAAKQIGMNPAEMAYMRAQSLGYKSGGQPGQEADAQPQGGQSEADKVQALAKAQDATSGVSNSGAPQEGAPTVAQLAKMTEDEIAKIPDDQFKKIMGG